MITMLQGCAVTMDAGRRERPSGHVVVPGNRLVAVGAGPAPTMPDPTVVYATAAHPKLVTA